MPRPTGAASTIARSLAVSQVSARWAYFWSRMSRNEVTLPLDFAALRADDAGIGVCPDLVPVLVLVEDLASVRALLPQACQLGVPGRAGEVALQEVLARPSQRLLVGPAEQLLGLVVPVGDLELAVHGDDRVVHAVEQPGLPCDRRFGRLALGDVGEHREVAHVPAPVVVQRRVGDQQPDVRAVAPGEPEVVARAIPRPSRPPAVVAGRVRGEQFEHAPSDQVVAREAEQLSQSVVRVGDDAARVAHRDALVGGRHDQAEPRFGRAPGFFAAGALEARQHARGDVVEELDLVVPPVARSAAGDGEDERQLAALPERDLDPGAHADGAEGGGVRARIGVCVSTDDGFTATECSRDLCADVVPARPPGGRPGRRPATPEDIHRADFGPRVDLGQVDVVHPEVGAETGAGGVHDVFYGGDLRQLVLQVGEESQILLAPFALRHVPEGAREVQRFAAFVPRQAHEAGVPTVRSIPPPPAGKLGHPVALQVPGRARRLSPVVRVDVGRRERAVQLAQFGQRHPRDRGRRRADVVEVLRGDVEPVDAVDGAVQGVAQAPVGLSQRRVGACPPHLRPRSRYARLEEVGFGLRPFPRRGAADDDGGHQLAVLLDGGGEARPQSSAAQRRLPALFRLRTGGWDPQHERPAAACCLEFGGERREVQGRRRVPARVRAALYQSAGLVDFVEGRPRGPELLAQQPGSRVLHLDRFWQGQQRIRQPHGEGLVFQSLPLLGVQRLDAVVEGDEHEHPRAGEYAEPDQQQVLVAHPALCRHDDQGEDQARGADRDRCAPRKGDGREDHHEEIRRGDGVAGNDKVHHEDDRQPDQRQREGERAPPAQPRHR